MQQFDMQFHCLHRARHVALFAILGMSAAGCGQTETPKNDIETQLLNSGGTFRMAQDSPGSLDPAELNDSYEASIVNLVFDGLLAYDRNLNTGPRIAESWTISDDGLVYDFQLRPGVRFHDGSEVSAEDVVYSLTRIFHLDPASTILAREYLSHIEGSAEYAAGEASTVSGLEALGPLALRIKLESPYASFLSVLASEMARIVPKAYVERVGNEDFALHPVGCGPFTMEEWIPNQRIVLLRFDDYHAERAQLDSVVYELPEVGHRDYAVRSFQAGRLDGLEIPPNRLAELRNDPSLQIYMRQELSLSYMALNLNRRPFNDPRVRRAFALSVDQEFLCSLYEGSRQAPLGILPPGMPGSDPEHKLPGYDLDAAKLLLAEAGYANGDGLPTIIHASANDSEGEREMHGELRAMLAEAGFRIETLYLNWLEFDERIRNGEFDTYSLTWVADLPDPDSFLYPLFHSAGSTNLHHYSNAQVDALLNDGRSSRSTQERWELYRSAERLILSDAPVIPLYHATAIFAVHDNVMGFGITPLGIGNLPLKDVWFQNSEPGSSEVAR